MKRTGITAGALVLATLTLGCGDGGRAAVSGTVMLDGQPLPEGSITFFPTDGNRGPSAGGVIQDGTFEIDTRDGPMIGKNRVEIRSNTPTGRKIIDPRMPTMQLDEILAVPKRYNSDSELVRDLHPGHNELNFELNGK
jgi:hypothetical protein